MTINSNKPTIRVVQQLRNELVSRAAFQYGYWVEGELISTFCSLHASHSSTTETHAELTDRIRQLAKDKSEFLQAKGQVRFEAEKTIQRLLLKCIPSVEQPIFVTICEIQTDQVWMKLLANEGELSALFNQLTHTRYVNLKREMDDWNVVDELLESYEFDHIERIAVGIKILPISLMS